MLHVPTAKALFRLLKRSVFFCNENDNTDIFNTRGITKNGLLRILALYTHGEENQECQADLGKIIQELTVADPVERNFTGSYSDDAGVFVVSLSITKDRNNCYSLNYRHFRP